MSYTVVYKKSAEKELLRLPVKYAFKIKEAIDKLSKNPYPHNSKKISGSINEYRIRINDYRVIYTVNDDVISVFVIKIAHRKDVYK